MNVHVYIETGIVQDYCLGLLSPAEMEEVERHAAIYPPIRAELEACRLALEKYVRSLAIPAPDMVKNKALGVIDNLKEK